MDTSREEAYKGILEEYHKRARNDNNFSVDGKGNYIHKTAIIYPEVELGHNNYIGEYCIIGAAGEVASTFPKEGRVKIGNNNVFAGLVTVDASVNESSTFIGSNNFLMKQTHVGHDAMLTGDCRLAPGARVGGETILEPYVNLGMNSCIHQRVVVRQGCMIGMGAVVTKTTDTKPWRKYAGVPAKDIGSNEAFKK